MSENKLIMPKQTGQKDAFYASLKIYYDSWKNNEEWFSNNDFKIKIQKELPYLSQGAKNGPYLVKQSELTRYFGLVLYDYSTQVGRARITEAGINFYEAYLENNQDLQNDIIMQAIFNNSFGRNNTAIKSGDSDIDPPKLFIKAITDLNGITKKEFANLLYITNDLKIEYSDAISEISKSNGREIVIPVEKNNKYNDVKFIVFLNEIGIINIEHSLCRLNENIKQKYKNNLSNLSIYNRHPEIVLTLNENLNSTFVEETDEDIEIENQKNILISYTYNISDEKFKQQNNRIPVTYKRGNNIRYKTNSRIAKTAIDIANYKCICDENHTTFISKIGKPYMEAHHLIPMAFQKDFDINIDRIENIVSICPNCHSAVHLGEEETKTKLVKKLYDIKISELKSVGINISFEELYSKYYK